MPTKGARRAHQAFTTQPATGYAPTEPLDTNDTASAGDINTDPGRLGDGWVADTGTNVGLPHHDVPPDWLRQRPDGDRPDPDDQEPADELASDSERQGSGGDRNPERTYRGDTVEVRCNNITSVRQQADQDPVGVTTPVAVAVDGHQVGGDVAIERERRGRRAYAVTGAELSCDCGQDPCEHRERAVEAVRALVNGRRVRSAVGVWEQTRARAAQRLQAAAATQAASRARLARPEPDGPAWSDDDNYDSFQAEYDAARARHGAGEPAVPFVRENATGGLGARAGGRGFGVELEFDLAGVPDQSAALAAIGADLHQAGLTASSQQTGYHSGRNSGYRQWSFERDSTVSGEIVSPVLYDEPGCWDQLAQVCDIIKRHGGKATARTGGHVHIGCSDFDHTVENHNRLLAMAGEYEDTLYRLSHNPHRPAHRGLAWCSPNRTPSAGYRTVGDVQRNQGSHGIGVNFGSVGGTATDHVEFRMWDASLDPGVIQTQINLSLGLTEAAFGRHGEPGRAEPVGTHRQTNARLRRGERLAGQQWRDDTRSFRRLIDTVFWRESNKRQAAALFGVTRWQRSR